MSENAPTSANAATLSASRERESFIVSFGATVAIVGGGLSKGREMPSSRWPKEVRKTVYYVRIPFVSTLPTARPAISNRLSTAQQNLVKISDPSSPP